MTTEEYRSEKGPIQFFQWGRFTIDGYEHGEGPTGTVGKGKDIRLIGTEVTRWKERRGHILSCEMITSVYDRDIEVLIIGIGAAGRIEVPQEVIRDIEKHDISRLVIARTTEACRLYNRLYHEGKRVALLAHGTC